MSGNFVKLGNCYINKHSILDIEVNATGIDKYVIVYLKYGKTIRIECTTTQDAVDIEEKFKGKIYK